MDLQFSQGDFGGGLDLNLDSTKVQRNASMFISHGRVRRNSIEPVKKHKKLAGKGTHLQGLFSAGSWLVLFSDGIAYYWDISSDAGFQVVPYWTAMDTEVDFIEACVIPSSTSKLRFANADPTNGSLVYDSSIPGNAAALFVTDGVNQSRIIDPASGTWRVTQNYTAWTLSSLEYVPIGVNPVISGGKFYLLSPDRKLIYHSVSGRYLDFVVNRNSGGDKGGDASTVAKALDFNKITAMFPSASGGLIVTTLYNTYAITPDWSATIFGEPRLPDETLFPVGALNNRSFVDILGDTAFINQEGIQSFNQTQQTKISSNNFPQGAPIAKALIQPQERSCVGNWQNYAFFALDTIYGPCTVVFDQLTKTYCSFDFDFGDVKQFALVRTEGQQRLFFITWNNELYEAFAGDEYSTCRIYLGEFTPEDGSRMFTVQEAYAGFNNIHGSVDFQLSLYCNKKLIERALKNITGPSIDLLTPPLPIPFNEGVDADTVFLKLKDQYQTDKCGLYIEWNGKADLVDATIHGTSVHHFGTKTVIPATDSTTKVVCINDMWIGSTVANTADFTEVAVTVGNGYILVGEAFEGGSIIQSCRYVPKQTPVSIKGLLYNAGSMNAAMDLVLAEDADLVVGAGDILMSSGSTADLARVRIYLSELLAEGKFAALAGNHDLDTLSGKWFYSLIPSQRFYSRRIGNIEFFFIDSGYNTAGSVLTGTPRMPVGPCLNPNGNTSDSEQAFYIKNLLSLSTARFKIAVTHQPPYSSGNYYPGYVPLRWNFRELGFNMVISGHDHNYQRRTVDGVIYIVNGWFSNARYGKHDDDADLFYNATQGYLIIESDEYNMRISAKDVSGTIIDAFTVTG